MEVNERIIEEYLKLIKGWFYMSDISFSVPNGYSNIDLLAYDQKNDIYYDMEIKYRSAKQMEHREYEEHIFQLTRPERAMKIKELIEKTNTPTKVFVTTKKYFGKSDEKEQKLIAGIKENGYKAEVWYFDNILPELYEKINVKGSYNTELTQTIRLIKTYIA